LGSTEACFINANVLGFFELREDKGKNSTPNDTGFFYVHEEDKKL